MNTDETRLQQAERHLRQAHAAFMQDPTPRLAAAMRQLAGVIMYERRLTGSPKRECIPPFPSSQTMQPAPLGAHHLRYHRAHPNQPPIPQHARPVSRKRE